MSFTQPFTQPPIHPPIVGSDSINQKSSKRIELSWLGCDLFDFQWFDMTPAFKLPIKPFTHSWVEGVSTEFKSSNRIELSWLIQDPLNHYWFGGTPIVWVAEWVELGGGVSTDHKSSNRIQLSRLDDDLFKFY